LHLKNDICRNWFDESTVANLTTSTSFKYFAVNGNTLFAMNELPINTNNGLFDEEYFGKIFSFFRNTSDYSTLSGIIGKKYLDIKFSS
jgi:hypothetical protein